MVGFKVHTAGRAEALIQIMGDDYPGPQAAGEGEVDSFIIDDEHIETVIQDVRTYARTHVLVPAHEKVAQALLSELLWYQHTGLQRPPESIPITSYFSLMTDEESLLGKLAMTWFLFHDEINPSAMNAQGAMHVYTRFLLDGPDPVSSSPLTVAAQGRAEVLARFFPDQFLPESPELTTEVTIEGEQLEELSEVLGQWAEHPLLPDIQRRIRDYRRVLQPLLYPTPTSTTETSATETQGSPWWSRLWRNLFPDPEVPIRATNAVNSRDIQIDAESGRTLLELLNEIRRSGELEIFHADIFRLMGPRTRIGRMTLRRRRDDTYDIPEGTLRDIDRLFERILQLPAAEPLRPVAAALRSEVDWRLRSGFDHIPQSLSATHLAGLFFVDEAPLGFSALRYMMYHDRAAEAMQAIQEVLSDMVDGRIEPEKWGERTEATEWLALAAAQEGDPLEGDPLALALVAPLVKLMEWGVGTSEQIDQWTALLERTFPTLKDFWHELQIKAQARVGRYDKAQTLNARYFLGQVPVDHIETAVRAWVLGTQQIDIRGAANLILSITRASDTDRGVDTTRTRHRVATESYSPQKIVHDFLERHTFTSRGVALHAWMMRIRGDTQAALDFLSIVQDFEPFYDSRIQGDEGVAHYHWERHLAEIRLARVRLGFQWTFYRAVLLADARQGRHDLQQYDLPPSVVRGFNTLWNDELLGEAVLFLGFALTQGATNLHNQAAREDFLRDTARLILDRGDIDWDQFIAAWASNPPQTETEVNPVVLFLEAGIAIRGRIPNGLIVLRRLLDGLRGLLGEAEFARLNAQYFASFEEAPRGATPFSLPLLVVRQMDQMFHTRYEEGIEAILAEEQPSTAMTLHQLTAVLPGWLAARLPDHDRPEMQAHIQTQMMTAIAALQEQAHLASGTAMPLGASAPNAAANGAAGAMSTGTVQTGTVPAGAVRVPSGTITGH